MISLDKVAYTSKLLKNNPSEKLLFSILTLFSCIFFKAFPGFSTILYRFPIHLTFSLQSGQEGFYLIGRFSYETKKGYCQIRYLIGHLTILPFL